MKKKSRHRLNEMKENEAKRKSAEVDTTTLSGLPVFGKTLECIKDRHGLLQGGFEAFGPIFTITLLNRRAVVLIGPEYQQLFFTEP